MKETLLNLSEWLMLIVGCGFVILCLLDFPGGDDRPEWEKGWERQWKRERRAERLKRFHFRRPQS